MKICLSCAYRYEGASWRCPSCQEIPIERNGILIFGPAVSDETCADASYLDEQIRAAEARHFWFRARLQLVLWMLQRYFPDARTLLDVGCGTGFVLNGIQRQHPSLALAGCDVRIDTLSALHTELGDVPLIATDISALPYESEFDVVIALDVIEHIDDDCAALRALLNVLKPGGGLILTVPQHPWLWSEVDDFSCHRRRYVRSELESKIERAGFDMLRRTSFFAATLALLAVSRWRRRTGAFDPAAELNIHPRVNTGLAWLVSLEALLVKLGGSLPFGSSLVIVGRRPIAA